MGARLVRDRALENWCVPGAEHQVRPVASGAEHLLLLHAKLLEEAGEVIFAQSEDERVKELSDVLSVLEGIAAVAGISWDRVRLRQHAREIEGGGFTQGMVWETSR